MYSYIAEKKFNLKSQNLMIVIGVMIPDAVISIWAELFDHSKFDISMQIFCTKLQKKDTFGGKVYIYMQI